MVGARLCAQGVKQLSERIDVLDRFEKGQKLTDVIYAITSTDSMMSAAF